MSDTTKLMRKCETIEQAARGWADILGIWRLCNKPACQRAQGCRGPIRACFKAYYPLLPESMQLWFEMIADAQDEGLSWDEALDGMKGTLAEDALQRWRESIDRAADIVKGRNESPAGTRH